MSVFPVDSSTTSPGGAEAATGPRDLNRDDFLKMLTAQLANQDPLEPMQGSEFVAQLATFSNVEQLIQVNQRLGLLEVGQAAIANAQTANLIGREVTASSDQITISSGEAPPLAFELEGKASDVKVSISDSEGKIVRTIDLGQRDAGANQIDWDGNDMNGIALRPGVYKVSVSASDIEGNPIAAHSRTSGVITGVTFENGFPELLIGSIRVRLGDIITLKTAEEQESLP